MPEEWQKRRKRLKEREETLRKSKSSFPSKRPSSADKLVSPRSSSVTSASEAQLQRANTANPFRRSTTIVKKKDNVKLVKKQEKKARKELPKTEKEKEEYKKRMREKYKEQVRVDNLNYILKEKEKIAQGSSGIKTSPTSVEVSPLTIKLKDMITPEAPANEQQNPTISPRSKNDSTRRTVSIDELKILRDEVQKQTIEERKKEKLERDQKKIGGGKRKTQKLDQE